MTADVGFYVDLARRADGPLVELAVGNGRVAIPVATSTGRRVIGIDFSPAMLELARVGAVEAGVDLDLGEGDMRDLSIDQPAAQIYCPFRALFHLPTWSDRRRTFERIAAALCLTGGSPSTHSPSITASLRASTACISQGLFRTQFGTRSATTGSTSRSMTAGRARCGGPPRTSGSGFWMLPASRSRALYGGFRGQPFTDDSREYVVVARRFQAS